MASIVSTENWLNCPCGPSRTRSDRDLAPRSSGDGSARRLGDPDRVLSGGPRWGYGDPREPSGLLARAIRSARPGHARERKEEGDPGRPERVPPENVGKPVGPQIDAGGAHHEGDQGRARPYEGPAPIRCARRKDDREHRVEGNRLGGVT